MDEEQPQALWANVYAIEYEHSRVEGKTICEAASEASYAALIAAEKYEKRFHGEPRT